MVSGYSSLTTPASTTTALPAPTIDSASSTQDDITVSWTLNDNSTDGNVVVQLSTDNGATWSDAKSVPLGSTSTTVEDVQDSTIYEVRVDRRTPHASTPSGSLEATTTNFEFTNIGSQSVSFEWREPDAFSQDGYRVERQQTGVTGWEELADLGPTTETYTDNSVIPGTEYEYRIIAYNTSGTLQVGSGTVTTLGGGQRPRVTSSGWSAAIAHPTSGRVIRPDVLAEQVQFIPGPNMMPRIRLPVRRAPAWLDEEFNDNPTMTVHLDGDELPIDELVDVEHETGRTILIGEGGAELRTTVEVEYDAAERPSAATNLVSNNTTYSVVDNTAAGQTDSQVVQSPSGETDLGTVLSPGADVPLVFMGGGVRPAQTCWTTEAENTVAESGTGFFDADRYSEGTAEEWNSQGDQATYEFTPEYDIPASNFGLYWRVEANNSPEITVTVNGNSWVALTDGGTVSGPQWQDIANDSFGGGTYTGGDFQAGTTYTVMIEATGSGGSTPRLRLDVLAPLDTRYNYTFDNTVNTAGGYLDGPELYPPGVDAVFDAYQSAFSVVGGSASVTITDTSNNQALALSNDFGSTYPITATNTTSVSGDFPSTGAALNLKATLSRYSPQGARNQTPRLGYDAQRLDAYELTAEIKAESLLIDESYDNNLSNILNQILGSQYGWTITNENGTMTFTVDEPGSTVSDSDPEISESKIQKRIQTYDKTVIKGSNLPVDGEEFQASTSFVNLTEDNIVTGSEAVTDTSGTQYTRGVDYSMNYGAGKIKALSGGSLTTSDTYTISYHHQIQASYTTGGGSGDTLTRTIPGVVSDRQAEQIAYVITEVYPGVSTPRYEGDIVVPRLDANFDPLEGLQLADMDLPSAATPLSIRGEPQLTPLGLTLRLGSAPRLEESLSNIREQVSAVSDRV